MAQLGSAFEAYGNGLMTVANNLFAGRATTIMFGMPAFDALPDIVSLGTGTSQSEPGPISPRRPREETLTQEVIISCYRAGMADQEPIARAAALQYLRELEEYVRVTDTTLGGVVRHCFLTNFATAPATDDDVLEYGRMQVITATFTAKDRITS